MGYTSKKSLEKTKKEHTKFLKSLGLRTGTPLKKSQLKGVPMPDLSVDSSKLSKTSDKIGHVTKRKSVLDPMALQHENEQTQQKIKEWAARVGPAFNKGGYQVINLDELKGNKRR